MREVNVLATKPQSAELPFFAYGLFQPGQIAYFQIRNYVLQKTKATVKGSLRVRDGLPIYDPTGSGHVDGAVITFKDGMAIDAYTRIAHLEPSKQYRWAMVATDQGDVNILKGVSPKQGSVSLEETDEKEWDGWTDPLFKSALEVVQGKRSV